MASIEMSRGPSVASSSEVSIPEPAAPRKSVPKKEKATGGVNLKKSIAKKTRPKDVENPDIKTAITTRSPSPSSPAVNGTNLKESDKPSLIQCKHCKKNISETYAEAHYPRCLEQKKEKARKKKEAKEVKAREAKAREAAEAKDKDGDSIMGDNQAQAGDEGGDRPDVDDQKPIKKSATKKSTSANKKSKKRKADDAADKEPKKKKLKKDEPPKPKAAKPKGPVNVETQCGVKLPNGGECARSLTCKSHSMGAKRAVPGRSLPYDQLLAMYQKRNAAKIQKQHLQQQAPLLEDEGDKGPVDSEEEKDAVMAAIARSRPKPLEQHTFIATTRKYQYIRMKEALSNALGARGAGAGSIFGGQRQVLVGDPPSADSAAPSASGEGTVGEGQRKQSFGHQGSQSRAAAAVAPLKKPNVASTVAS